MERINTRNQGWVFVSVTIICLLSLYFVLGFYRSFFLQSKINRNFRHIDKVNVLARQHLKQIEDNIPNACHQIQWPLLDYIPDTFNPNERHGISYFRISVVEQYQDATVTLSSVFAKRCVRMNTEDTFLSDSARVDALKTQLLHHEEVMKYFLRYHSDGVQIYVLLKNPVLGTLYLTSYIDNGQDFTQTALHMPIARDDIYLLFRGVYLWFIDKHQGEIAVFDTRNHEKIANCTVQPLPDIIDDAIKIDLVKQSNTNSLLTIMADAYQSQCILSDVKIDEGRMSVAYG